MRRTDGHSDIRGKPMASEYWEGFYAFGEGTVVRLGEGPDGGSAAGFSLRDGKRTFTFGFVIEEDTRIDHVFAKVYSECGERYRARLSSEVETPDRHAQIEAALERGDPFSMAQIRELTKRLMSDCIITMGGLMGYRDLYDADYAGFYLLSDGSVMRCRDLTQWDDAMGIVDGVQDCVFLDPDDLSSPPSGRTEVGYLRGDTFAFLADRLAEVRGRPVTEIGLEGSEAYAEMEKAVGGDANACEVCRHRIRRLTSSR